VVLAGASDAAAENAGRALIAAGLSWIARFDADEVVAADEAGRAGDVAVA